MLPLPSGVLQALAPVSNDVQAKLHACGLRPWSRASVSPGKTLLATRQVFLMAVLMIVVMDGSSGAADSPTGSGISDASLAVVALLGEIPKTRPRASEPKPRSAITDIRI